MRTFLKNKEFRWITISDLISVFGDSIFYLAMIAYASSFDNSSLAITLVTISETLPDALSAITGYWSDRTKRKMHADYLSSLVRALLYCIVAILFAKWDGWNLLLVVIIINVFSDLLGTYSDNLRFPEIYAIVPDEEYETSAGFSSALYYIFNLCGKMSGGIVLILLQYRYDLFALLNAITFILCGLCLLKVKKSVDMKIKMIEQEKCEDKKESFIQGCISIIQNKPVFRVIICFVVINGLVGSLMPVVYIILANENMGVDNYTYIISCINILSMIGAILGNLLSGIIFKNVEMHKMIGINVVVLLIASIMVRSNKIVLIMIGIASMFFIHGAISIKFSKFLFSRQEYESLGLSVGITNTILTISVPIILTIIVGIGNISNCYVSVDLIILSSFIFLATILVKKENLIDDKN